MNTKSCLLLGSLHRLLILQGAQHPTRPAEPDVRNFHVDDHFRPVGTANHAAVRHATLPVRGSRTPLEGLFLEGIHDEQHRRRASVVSFVRRAPLPDLVLPHWTLRQRGTDRQCPRAWCPDVLVHSLILALHLDFRPHGNRSG